MGKTVYNLPSALRFSDTRDLDSVKNEFEDIGLPLPLSAGLPPIL